MGLAVPLGAHATSEGCVVDTSFVRYSVSSRLLQMQASTNPVTVAPRVAGSSTKFVKVYEFKLDERRELAGSALRAHSRSRSSGPNEEHPIRGRVATRDRTSAVSSRLQSFETPGKRIGMRSNTSSATLRE